MGVTWPAFVRSWAAPGLSWVRLGRLLGASWHSWLSLGCSVKLQGRISAPRIVPVLFFKRFGDVPDLVLRAFQSSCDVLFATPRISSHNAFKNAVTTLCYLLRLFVSPLQRGGKCAAHGIEAFASHGRLLSSVCPPLPHTLLQETPRCLASPRGASQFNWMS